MKKATLFALMVFTTLLVNGQDITGQWNGALSIQGTELRIVFNITKTVKGYSSTMDSPDQGAKGIPVTSTTFENSILKIEVSNFKIEYSGELKENKITGTFKQGAQSLPLNLSREKIEKKSIARPQEPVKPYPYYSEEVTFENKKDKVTLAGTLTLPRKEGTFPAVVLITGSGPQNRNEELFGHKPFLVLSDYLTKNGIAVLRYDDRGTAQSTGNFETATSLDFAADATSAVEYLQKRKEIDQKKIGLIGHSEGGMIAPMIAAKVNSINFIVLLAGPGIPGEQLLLLQQELIGKVYGVKDSTLQRSKIINKGAFDIVAKSTDQATLKTSLTNYFKHSLGQIPESEKPSGISDDNYIKLQVSQLSSAWMQYFIKYDPSVALEKVKCAVLAINGEKDLQVPAEINLEAIKKSLQKGGNKNATIKELAGLNHLFQECKTGSPQEYATIEQTFSPMALAEITTWIRQLK